MQTDHGLAVNIIIPIGVSRQVSDILDTGRIRNYLV